jgi:hypothetical protein
MNVFSKVGQGIHLTPGEQSFFKTALTAGYSALALGMEGAASYFISGRLNLQLTLTLGVLLASVTLLTGFGEFLLASKNPALRLAGTDLQTATKTMKQDVLTEADHGQVLFPHTILP